MKKRLLAAIMSLCMIVSLLPVSALAYEGEEEPAVQSRNGGYPAEFFVVKPDVSNDNFYMGTDTNDFVSVGKGWVGGDIPDPNNSDVNNGKFDISAYPNWKYTPPTNTSQYPTVTYQNRQYSYWDEESPRPENNYYTITWYRYSNAYASESEGNVWHVDGYVSLNDWPSVAYQVQFPNKADFDWVDSSGESQENASYSYVNSGTTFAKLETTPDMPDKGEYTFDGWYTDEGCADTDKVNDSTPITEDTIFYGRYVKKGPDLTVTKELTKVVRDGVELTGALSDDTTLYAGDVVTWKITVTNHTDSIISNLAIRENFKVGNFEIGQFPDEPNGYTLTATESTDNLSAFSVESKQSKTFEVSYTIKSYDDGNILSNTVTVQNSEVTASASTENDIGYTIKVTYNGNGGTLADTSKTKTVTARVESTSNNYTVEDDSFGFSYSGHTFAGWYTQQGGSGENVTGKTVSIENGATYFAKWAKDEEPVDPDTDIFFFISLPSNDEAMSGEEEDYRYLTHGGVIDETEEDLDVVKTTGITSLDDESEITRFVSEWPTATTSLPGDTDVGFDIASPSVENGSSWTIDENGNVTEFSITITDEKNEEYTYTSDKYGIRWAKISYATTAVDGSENIDASKRYHVDGVLYSKETVSEVLTDENFQKTVDSDTLSYNNDGTLKSEETFSFALDMLTGKDGQPSDAFKDIALTATVTDTEKNAKICLPENSTDGSTPLTPGYYVIQETLEGNPAKAWKDPDPIYFELTSNGNVLIKDSKNTITNTLETYTLTYNLGGATGDAPTGGTYYYNQKAPVAAAPVWSGHTFWGWSDGTTTYQPGSTIQIKGTTTLTAQWDTIQYTLTYDANGGTGAPEPVTGLSAGPYTLSTTVPTHAPENGKNVAFVGWSLTDTNKIYEAGAMDVPETTTSVQIVNANITVHAVWGYDEDGDGVADVNEIVVTPADITIYTGGSSYQGGIVDEYGNPVTDSSAETGYNGFPTPGFYITLPTNLNNALKGDGTGPVDLSNKLSFSYQAGDVNRTWTLNLYNEDSPSNVAFEKYVYRLVAGAGQENVRLQIMDGNTAVPSDRFDFASTNLFETYTMSIYGGAVETNDVKATVNGQNYDVYVDTGSLTVRGTTDNAATVAVNDQNNTANGFRVTADGENNYYINGSNIEANSSSIHLLADGLAMTADTASVMQNAALDALGEGHGLTDPQYNFMYLDLVDTSNGNAYVTMQGDDSVTIHWPMPANADPDTVRVVHFDGLDRDFSVDDLNAILNDPNQVTMTTYESGNGLTVNGNNISFQTSTFSPFVLVYEEKAQPVNPDHGGGSGGGHDNDDSDPTGNLSIELDVNGGDDEFTFTVILTDRDGDDLKNNFYYNGDYTGTIGSGDEITLEGGEKIVIHNLPEGTRYEVIIETADGYTYIIDGEEGIIRIGMNEAEFTANRTVSLADPSVTGVSRWLNTTDHIAYLTGYPSGAFGPDNSMTRAEVAQMFYALLNNKNVTITKTFPDVPSDAWYATAVNTLASLGMVSGDATGNYRPNDPITRSEFCVIALAFAYEPENAVCYFGDVSRSDWFYTYVAQAASYGWIGGYADGSFGPNDLITRAQVTTIVNNMLGREADRGYVNTHTDTLVQFYDLTSIHWAYYDIMEAVNEHEYTRTYGVEDWVE